MTLPSLLPYYVNIALIALAWGCSVPVAKRQDRNVRFMSHLLGITAIIELASLIYAKRYHNNMPIYAVFNPVNCMLTCFYFNEAIDVFRRRHVGFIIGIVSLAVGITNLVFLQPINHLNNYYLFFEGILIISLSLLSYTRLTLAQYNNEKDVPLYHNLHFWIASILTFFWTTTFLSWGLYEFLSVKSPASMWLINLLIITVNIITYGSFSILFLAFRKMQPCP